MLVTRLQLIWNILTYFDADEFIRLTINATSSISVKVAEEHCEAEDHCAGAADFVDLPGFSQSRFDDVAVIVVIFDIMTEYIGRHFDGQHVVNDQFAETCQVIAPFVQLFNFRVLVLLFVILFNEHVRLDEIVERLLQTAVWLVDQRA